MSKFPFFNMQQLNLDWIMTQLKKVLAFLPFDGSPGQILQRGSQSARWVNIGAVSMDIHGLQTAETVTGSDELPVYNTSVEGNRKMTISALAAMLPSPTAPVTSVNGKTGAVVLDAEDVGALPDSYTAPVTSVNGMTGDVIVSGGGGGAVDSVNGQTGEVVLTAADVGAMSAAASVSDLFMGNNTYSLYPAVNTTLDPNNDSSIISSGVIYQRSANKKTIRICGAIELTMGSNTGWRTFEITGLDIADIKTGHTYIHRDYSCSLYEGSDRKIWISSAGTFCNYRVMADKTIQLFISVSSDMAGKTFMLVFDGVPFQIA